jgi:hypothetical protein
VKAEQVFKRRLLPSDPAFLFEKIRAGESFSLMRFADGERSLMEGQEVSIDSQAFKVDRWSSPPKKTRLGFDLTTSISFYKPGLIHAISCPCCSQSDFNYLFLRGGANIPFTHSNIFINGYYTEFKLFVSSISKPINLIVNRNSNLSGLPFLVKQALFVPSDCVNEWEFNSENLVRASRKLAMGALQEIFLIAAGPMSEVFIREMLLVNSENTYIDVGSALDELLFLKKTRPFMDENHPFSRLRCNIQEGLRAKDSRNT